MNNDEKKHLLEGYKVLMQYGIQMSQDHLNYDKILMPLSLVPAFFVLTSTDVQKAGLAAELLIWGAGPLMLWFWHSRNKRSRDRLYKVWDTLCSIEKRLCFSVFRTVHDYMNDESRPITRRDFEIKALFVRVAIVAYIIVLIYVFWRDFAN